MKFFNELSPAELERLSLLMEEMGEAIQIIGKIQRHGYESKHPDNMDGPTNRQFLEKELGDVLAAMALMCRFDISFSIIETHKLEKLKNVAKYLHHQPKDTIKELEEV